MSYGSQSGQVIIDDHFPLQKDPLKYDIAFFLHITIDIIISPDLILVSEVPSFR